MVEIHTYPEMNAKIKDLLRIGEQPICLYAAKRIEELEEYERKKGICINDEYFYCQAVGRQPQDENVISRRPDWCPLVDVSDDTIVLTRDEFAFYSRCMLIALELRDLLADIRLFEEKINPAKPKGEDEHGSN